MKRLSLYLASDEVRPRFAIWSAVIVGIYSFFTIGLMLNEILKR